MGEKKTIIITACLLALLLVIGFLWVHEGEKGAVSYGNASPATAGAIVYEPPISGTRTAIAANLTVPNEDAQNVPANVAVPQDQVSASPSTGSIYRSFSISIKGKEFMPDTVIVRQGDVVNLEMSAIDGSYGFTQPDYGFDFPIPQGEMKRLQFAAMATGTFTFYCSSCGGPTKGPVGHIIVMPK